MLTFSVTNKVITTRQVRAGVREDGPLVCEKDIKGCVVQLEPNEWDGVHVRLNSGLLWWFKPSQLNRLE